MPLVNLPKQKRLPPEIYKAREQKQTTNMAKHNTNLQAVSAIKKLTTPSCSEALDFHSRRFVSSLPETRYVPSQVYFTQNTLQSSRRYLSEKYAQNGNIMISLVVNYFLKSETIQKTKFSSSMPPMPPSGNLYRQTNIPTNPLGSQRWYLVSKKRKGRG